MSLFDQIYRGVCPLPRVNHVFLMPNIPFGGTQVMSHTGGLLAQTMPNIHGGTSLFDF